MTGAAAVPPCELSDLPPDQCGCDRHRGKPEVFTGEPQAQMLARFSSRCVYCDARIEQDEPIYLIDDNWCCDTHVAP